MLEMLLHLTWRHIKYYSSDQASAQIGNFDRQRPFSRPQQSLSQSHLRASTLRFMSIPDSSSFRSEALSVTLKVVEKVSSIELVSVCSLNTANVSPFCVALLMTIFICFHRMKSSLGKVGDRTNLISNLWLDVFENLLR